MIFGFKWESYASRIKLWIKELYLQIKTNPGCLFSRDIHGIGDFSVVPD